MDAPRTSRGFTEHERARAADLYWEAFSRKLRPALVDDATGLALVRTALSPDRVLVARAGGSVVGICGFYEGNKGAVDLTWAGLRGRLSAAASVRALLLLAPLSRRAQRDALVLDGICVDPALRGRGIGSALLEAATDHARSRGARAVRLSVVDTNPRARALYDRLGFEPAGSGSLGPFGAVYGFSGYTVMERAVGR